MSRFAFRRTTNALAIVALAAGFTAAPAAINFGPLDDAAYAKGGNGGGGGGGKGNSSSASGKSKSKKSSTRGGKSGGKIYGKSKKSSGGGSGSETSLAAETEGEVETELVALRPDQKGKWNAANADQRALDVHIRNEKFNGTIGALAQYQLTGKAAAGEELNEDEQRALDNLLTGYDGGVTDGELEDLLNSGEEGAPVWEVVDGDATCVDNCDDADTDAANQQIADYEGDAAIEDLWTDSQQRIIDDSNKSTDGIEDQLLDELADDLGFSREAPEDDGGDSM